MIRFLLRALGFGFVATAFAALLVDGTRSIAGGRLLHYALGDTLAWLGGAHGAGLAAALAEVPAPVRTATAAVLAVPGWLVGGLLGVALLLAGRPRGRGISGPGA